MHIELEAGLNFKEKLSNLLDSRPFEIIMTLVIIASILIFIIQSVKSINRQFNYIFISLDNFFMILFSFEYILRLITLKKFKDLYSSLLFLDLIVILPFYFKLLSSNLFILRVFRLSRIIRIFKLARYNEAMNNIWNAVTVKKDELIIFGIIFSVAVIVVSSIMYIVEGHIQNDFSNIPKSMWWTTVTFTSVGYGDVVPKSDIGKLIASFAAIIGVAIHGLLASILISGFIETTKIKD